MARRKEPDRRRLLAPTPIGELTVDLISLAFLAASWAANRVATDSLLGALEDAARRADRSFRAQWGGAPARTFECGPPAVLRRHQEKVVDVPMESRSLVTQSLLNGLVFLARSDWESLLTVEPEARVRSMLRRMLPG